MRAFLRKVDKGLCKKQICYKMADNSKFKNSNSISCFRRLRGMCFQGKRQRIGAERGRKEDKEKDGGQKWENNR